MAKNVSRFLSNAISHHLKKNGGFVGAGPRHKITTSGNVLSGKKPVAKAQPFNAGAMEGTSQNFSPSLPLGSSDDRSPMTAPVSSANDTEVGEFPIAKPSSIIANLPESSFSEMRSMQRRKRS